MTKAEIWRQAVEVCALCHKGFDFMAEVFGNTCRHRLDVPALRNPHIESITLTTADLPHGEYPQPIYPPLRFDKHNARKGIAPNTQSLQAQWNTHTAQTVDKAQINK